MKDRLVYFSFSLPSQNNPFKSPTLYWEGRRAGHPWQKVGGSARCCPAFPENAVVHTWLLARGSEGCSPAVRAHGLEAAHQPTTGSSHPACNGEPSLTPASVGWAHEPVAQHQYFSEAPKVIPRCLQDTAPCSLSSCVCRLPSSAPAALATLRFSRHARLNALPKIKCPLISACPASSRS